MSETPVETATGPRLALLRALGNDAPIPGPALGDALGVSRAAVWKHVEALREAGFEIESGDEGYRIRSVPEYGAAAVAYGLDAPFGVEYHDRIDSTNARARELAMDGASDVAVLSDEQTAGRGRLDRGWAGPPGGVYLSLVLRPSLSPMEVPLLTLAAAVAVARAAREAGVDATIKWPNDVLVDEEKLAGVLTEIEGEADRVSWAVVGIGVNANVDRDALPEGATSILAEAGPVERRRFVQRVLETFDDLRGEPETILAAWREHAATLGRRVRVETGDGPIVGEAIDVEPPGTLLVDTDDGPVRVHAGDCEHLRPA